MQSFHSTSKKELAQYFRSIAKEGIRLFSGRDSYKR
jgi:hypothetical protein